MKIVINCAIGIFQLSHEAIIALYKAGDSHIEVDTLEERYGNDDGVLDEKGKESFEFDKAADYLTLFDGKILNDNHTGYSNPESRACPLLIKIVEELGVVKAGAKRSLPGESALKVVEIPDGVEFEINESEEGYESIHEKHRSWY